MASLLQPKAWLLMAAGDDRQHGGNSGYDDQADVYYTWDSTVKNYRNMKIGDPIVLWDKKRLLGVSVIEDIETTSKDKILFRCPVSGCGRASIKERKTKSPRYRCEACHSEFDAPKVETVAVTQYQSRHDAAWTSLENLLTGAELRELAESPRSQLSMRALDWARFKGAIAARGKSGAVETVLRRALNDVLDERVNNESLGPQGHVLATVRVRRGQQSFRDQLLRSYSETCAFTGSAPNRVLDAGHLYSYAELGEHHQHGGLLLRRDVHRLFDDGALAVDPSSLRIDVSRSLESFPQYASLHDKFLQVRINDKQAGWFDKHWSQHRLDQPDIL